MLSPIASRIVAWWRPLALGCALFALAGCASSGGGGKGGADVLRVEDLVEVRFSGTAQPPEGKDERIKADGTIYLPLIGSIQAAGKTAGQLQREIQDAYVPRFYQPGQLTVTVKSEYRMFYVYGEVRRPDRFAYSGQMTVLSAIAAAGGFTDFAAKTRVQLIRSNGERVEVNTKRALKNRSLDPAVYPGDNIYVPRRSPFGGMND
jgi:protein involved in polysaccharide export with SLBB domain